MLRLILYSRDHKLAPLLTATLGENFSIKLVTCTEDLKARLTTQSADVLLLDLDSNYSPTESGLKLLDELRNSPVPVVAMADGYNRAMAMELVRRGVYDCVQKPPSLVELRVILRRAHEHDSLRRELRDAREKLRSTSGCDMLIGSSGKAQVVYDLIRRVTNLDAYVLITGESGTGKELVARAIHNLSRRANSRFVAVSCGAIPETLIEAELFGHEKGAYTGTNGAREGYMEQAGDGTIFFDEIGELSLNTQVKLLRVLQQREFTRLGSTRPIPLRARVLFATHRNLDEMVEQGTFRRDLYFRVNVMRIRVPALRDRTEDIPTLARHFLHKYAAAYGKPVRDILPSAMELLVDYDWSGNIRELENVIQGAVILTDSESIGVADLPDFLQELAGPVEVQSELPNSFEDLLRQYKVRIANHAIAQCNGNKTLAARNLQISRAYLHRLVRMASPEVIADADVA